VGLARLVSSGLGGLFIQNESFMAPQQQQHHQLAAVHARLAALAAEIRGLPESGLLPKGEGQRAEQLHQELIDLNRMLLRSRLGSSGPKLLR